MNSNILPICDEMKYETHFLGQNKCPFIFHRDIVLGKRKECTPNLHLNLELLYFVEGSGHVICDGEAFAVQPGDLVVINSCVIHTVTTLEMVRYFCLIIDNDFCAANHIHMSKLRFFPLIRNGTARTLFAQLVQEYDSEDIFRETGIQCAVLKLLLYLCRNYSEQTPLDRKRDSALEGVWTAVEYMKQNLSQKLTVEQIAASAGFSKYYFLRLFKVRTGYTVTQYLNLLRCDRAKQLLLSGYAVKETAALCGFENPSYFAKVFKTCTGFLPGEILKRK